MTSSLVYSKTRVEVILYGHSTASPVWQRASATRTAGSKAGRASVCPPAPCQTAHVLSQPTATRAGPLGSQLLMDALAMPGRKPGPWRCHAVHLSVWAQSRNRLWFWALALETSCHWEILMQENKAVMLHIYPLVSLKLKSN